MKSKNLVVALTYTLVSLCSHVALATADVSCDLQQDTCSGKPLTTSQVGKSLYLGDQIDHDLEALHEQYLQQGKDLKVVIVGRMGNDLTKFKVLNDSGGKESIQVLIQKLIEETRIRQYRSQVEPKQLDSRVLRAYVDEKDVLEYSHLGIAFRNYKLHDPEKNNEVVTGPGTGKWSFFHLLYSCEKPDYSPADDQNIKVKMSHIFRGTVHAFFLDHLKDYKAQVIIPKQDIQDNLERILLEGESPNRFKNKKYNAVAKFRDMTQQNSNQFVLESLAAATKPVGVIERRDQAIKVLEDTGYAASKLIPTGLFSVVGIPGVQNLISSIMPTVCMKSQPEMQKYAVGEVVTANSVVNWMNRNNLVDQTLEIGLSQETKNRFDRLKNDEEKEENKSRLNFLKKIFK